MYDSMLSGEVTVLPLTLYTDSFVIRGSIRTRQRRVTDVLNLADEPFIIVTDATIDEYGSRGLASKADYAQVNLGAVLFAVTDEVQLCARHDGPPDACSTMSTIDPAWRVNRR